MTQLGKYMAIDMAGNTDIKAAHPELMLLEHNVESPLPCLIIVYQLEIVPNYGKPNPKFSKYKKTIHIVFKF